MSTKQLPLNLQPANTHSLQYFVSHSGVGSAVALLEQRVNEVLEAPETFCFVYLFGPPGSGKTHLIEGFCTRLLDADYPEKKVFKCFLEGHASNSVSWISQFVARYNELKTSGGIVFVQAKERPQKVSENPHIVSRLSSGDVLSLRYPSEAELEPLLLSLSERHNLKLSPSSMRYLLRRLPLSPLSFDNIFAKISELSFSLGKPAGLSVIRNALNN